MRAGFSQHSQHQLAKEIASCDDLVCLGGFGQLECAVDHPTPAPVVYQVHHGAEATTTADTAPHECQPTPPQDGEIERDLVA
jgi:hypothetical protein